MSGDDGSLVPELQWLVVLVVLLVHTHTSSSRISASHSANLCVHHSQSLK